jgi:dephospho-CoA kinase
VAAALRVGLTGGIGSGKSTVARLLADRGAVVIDADEIARRVTAPGTPGHDAVVGEFGPSVTDAQGGLDRAALARLVFADPAARSRLEAIVHPLVRAERERAVAAAPSGAVVVEDVPLLAEAGLAGEYDVVVVVEAPAGVRVDRLVARGMDAEDARARVAAQASDAVRRAVADVVIDNAGDAAMLAEQVDRLWAKLRGRAAVDNSARPDSPA